jgi:hypothetical protein
MLAKDMTAARMQRLDPVMPAPQTGTQGYLGGLTALPHCSFPYEPQHRRAVGSLTT